MTVPKVGSLVHLEFASPDPERTRRFLGEVFGWQFRSTHEKDYFVFTCPTGPGGAVTKSTEDRPPGILNYVLTSDLEADLARVERAGGKVRRGKTEIPNVGWWALVEEPTGCALGVFETVSPDRGPVARYR